ncbi:hypothetical protein EBB07_18535 [Paenibacillaceae bacterium]|nr:hypothetical protein EBB07_18535 [Paenibacillaceae bacterium]
MSITIIYELQHEIKRLFVRGSGLAASNQRLSGLLEQLQVLGENSAAFRRIASAVAEVVQPNGASTFRLLELGALMHSVLYTQGTTEVQGPLADLEGTAITSFGTLPYSRLNPLIEALSGMGANRLEVVKAAYSERFFRDIRLIPVSVAALNDSSAELADFVYENVVPEFEAAALPSLRQQFRLDGGEGAVRMLNLMYLILGESGNALYLQAAAEGSPELRAEATELLGYDAAHETFLLEQSAELCSKLRGAAYLALARLGSGQAVNRLYTALVSDDRDLAVEAIWQCSEPGMAMLVIAGAEQELTRLISGADKGEEREKTIERLFAFVKCLNHRREHEAFIFLNKLIAAPIFNVAETQLIRDWAEKLLIAWKRTKGNAMGTDEANDPKFIAFRFRTAFHRSTPEDLFDRYAPIAEHQDSAAARQLLNAISRLTPSITDQLLGGEERHHPRWRENWDARWLPLFVKLDERALICAFATDRDKISSFYLLNRVKMDGDYMSPQTSEMLLALLRMRHSDAPELLMNLLEQMAAQAPDPRIDNVTSLQQALPLMLPATYADRLKHLAESFPPKSVLRKQLTDTAKELQKANDSKSETKGLYDWFGSNLA